MNSFDPCSEKNSLRVKPQNWDSFTHTKSPSNENKPYTSQFDLVYDYRGFPENLSGLGHFWQIVLELLCSNKVTGQIKFSLNVYREFAEFSNKTIFTVERISRTFIS